MYKIKEFKGLTRLPSSPHSPQPLVKGAPLPASLLRHARGARRLRLGDDYRQV